jgi:hypothetical protein
MRPAAPARRPSPWWLTVAVVIAGITAWAAGAYGTEATSPPTVAAPAGPAPARVAEVAGFWEAVGSGDVATVLDAVDDAGGVALRHYAAFAAEFEAGFEPQGCRAIGPDTVRCTLRPTNADLIGLTRASGPAGATASATVTLTDQGIRSLQLPEVVNTASIVLLGHARSTGEIPPECDRIHHDALDLPPFNTSMAQTGDCARALVPLIPDAVAAIDR